MINLHGNFIESAQGRSSEELKDLEPQRNRGEVLGEMSVRVKVASRWSPALLPYHFPLLEIDSYASVGCILGLPAYFGSGIRACAAAYAVALHFLHFPIFSIFFSRVSRLRRSGKHFAKRCTVTGKAPLPILYSHPLYSTRLARDPLHTITTLLCLVFASRIYYIAVLTVL